MGDVFAPNPPSLERLGYSQLPPEGGKREEEDNGYSQIPSKGDKRQKEDNSDSHTAPLKGQTQIAHHFNGGKEAHTAPLKGQTQIVHRFNGGNMKWIITRLILNAARLTFIHRRFVPEWLKLKNEFPELASYEWKHWWAVMEADRLRLRVEIDALCAELYGLEPDDFDWIVRNDPTDPKGFWRVDKELPYEQRLTGLAAHAFRALKEGKWSAETVGNLSNDEFFEMLGIPELTNLEAAKAKGYEGPLIYNRQGCHVWKPESFTEDDPRYGWTWEHCRSDAIAFLGSEEALEQYLAKSPKTGSAGASPSRSNTADDALFDYKKPDPQEKLF